MYQQVIEFWFNEIEPSQWFKKDDSFDALLRRRFSKLHSQAAQCELWRWRKTASGSLAEIIVLDQFSRNMFRDTKAAFDYDALALALAQSAINKGQDIELSPTQRSFMYMPFMHSESAVIHEQALELFTQLGIKDNLDFEIKHKQIIDRFGRYPHRNDTLGRTSTPEEKAFLLQPGSGF
ncbi:Mannosyl-oligosaccharide 1,2-alpha-mannosidase [Saliniradius amylolyticus]|uniref:Mannosyl-oligosaccharide 1,2-alpha-mannosidase n=1 Tax=Saliniradius amylolyticus TaxID=2183582 RepID=A0A2S2E401_9ALTE|nr:DUF924 family protein [Saliniradius amylolyticus]AWL12363.1 Mannosyl-oligosaccharide 1,2-alpha-mannosidase [Saliniradius amylolyticus]